MGYINIKVSGIWAESKKCLCLLTIEENEVWSQEIWFAKDKCIYNPKGFIALPKWYYDIIFKGKIKPEILG